MTKTDIDINLNVNEISILLNAIEMIEFGEEVQINRECGSMSSLYDRLYQEYKKLDHSNVKLTYEPFIEPSFWNDNHSGNEPRTLVYVV